MTDPATGAAAILDLGCGGGAPIGAELLRRGFAITGIDNSPSLIRHARMSLPDGTWLVDDKRRFDPGDQRTMISCFGKLVRPGGSIMFTSSLEVGEAWGEWQGSARSSSSTPIRLRSYGWRHARNDHGDVGR